MTIYKCHVEVQFSKDYYVDVGTDEEIRPINAWETTKEKAAKRKAVGDALANINHEVESLLPHWPTIAVGHKGDSPYYEVWAIAQEISPLPVEKKEEVVIVG